MDNQPPTNASAWLARRPSAQVDGRDEEIARLKERLSFYESFDSLIQDNVSRAGELLRQAAEMRAGADQQVASVRQELEQSWQAERAEQEASRLAERQEYRALLSGLLDDVTTTQVQVERLARRVADALDELESTLPAGDDLDRLPKLATPLAAIDAPIYAEPLDPTPEEIGPEDPATIAANRAAAAAPPTVEAAVMAAEAIDLAAELEPAGHPTVEPIPGLEAEPAEPLEPQAAEAAVVDAEAAAVPEPAEAVAGPADVGTKPEFDAGANVEAVLDEVTLPPASESAESDGGAAAVAPTESPEDASDQTGAFVADEAAPAPQLDDAAVAADVQGADEAVEAGPAAPAVTYEDVIGTEAAAAAAEPAGDTPEESAALPSETPDESIVPSVDASAPADSAERAAAAAPEQDDKRAEPGSTDEGAESTDTERGGAPPRLPWIPDDVRPFSAEGLGEAIRRGTGELRAPEPPPRPEPHPPVGTGPLAGRGTSTVVLVHGVPRATTALSLKRYLESLPHVAAVEPREYAEGILRLHVTGQRHIEIGELRGWADGGQLEPVHVRDDLIEVRLPH